MTPDRGQDLAEVGRALAEAFGLYLSSGLERALRDGLASAASEMGVEPASLALRVVQRDPASLHALVEHAVVPETYFWRHPDQIAALAAVAFGATGPLAIWSAGCSSGEEPYSLAIALLEAGRAGRGDRIVATDVSDRLLEAARRGSYGPWSIRRLPRDLADRWVPGADERRVADEVRAPVEFRRHNLVADAAPGPFDVIVCRNVLIYFEALVAAEVLYRLVQALRPGGLLVVGPVELSLTSPLGLEWVDEGGATLLRRPR
ncbi:MAG TPA: CheR family methyltransferase [Anaeromyxobacteraceae bacterium]|nr:CheR family methyltransferase [Anaeromyxobacteraceae bacterium]